MSDVVITVRENGPYMVKGPIDLIDAHGNHFTIEKSTVFLCRRGGSSTKPFCDGTHSKIGFNAPCRSRRSMEYSGVPGGHVSRMPGSIARWEPRS